MKQLVDFMEQAVLNAGVMHANSLYEMVAGWDNLRELLLGRYHIKKDWNNICVVENLLVDLITMLKYITL